MVFEAVRGGSYQGDIALDDITFTDDATACPVFPSGAGSVNPVTTPPTQATTHGPTSGNQGNDCNFEQTTKPLCKFTQDRSDHFNWTVHQGHTWSTDTGPGIDHTLGTGIAQCTFMYLNVHSNTIFLLLRNNPPYCKCAQPETPQAYCTILVLPALLRFQFAANLSFS